MLANKIIVKCRSNCSVDLDGQILLGFGDSTVELCCEASANELSFPFGFLEFSMTPRAQLEKAPARIEIRWQDVVVVTLPVHLNGPIRLRVPIHSFTTPSALRITFTTNLDGRHYRDSYHQHSLSWAELSDVIFEPHSDELGQRRHLIGAAQFACRSLGLAGDYLDERRTQELTGRIHEAITECRPFSAIRLGDGEGRVLGYPNVFSDLEVLSQVLYYHFGPESMHRLKHDATATWINDAMLDLRSLLVQSIRQADVVGLPIGEYFDGYEKSPSHGLLGFACATNFGLAEVRHRHERDIVGADVFQVLAARGQLYRSAAGLARRVHVVGPWDIREKLSKALNVENVNWVQVPGHYTWRGEKGLGHYPDLYKYVSNFLQNMDDAAGELFFVGAGLLGKYYCSLIKERGGVALDIGSVIDSWAKRGLPYAVENHNIISFEKL